jgi:transposase
MTQANLSSKSNINKKERKHMEKLIVGVDMSKDKFTAANGWQKEIKDQGDWVNTADGCSRFADTIEEAAKGYGTTLIHLIIEPTGGYEAQLVAEAYRRGWWVTQVNPLAVSLWARGLGKRTKTDRQDARKLTQFGIEQNPEPQDLLADAPEQLAQLLHRQTDLEGALRAERNRLAQAQFNPRLLETVQQSIQRMIDAFVDELKTIHTAITQLISKNADLNRHHKQLLSVPSIGKKNAPYLLLACYRFEARTAGKGTTKQFSAYIGLDPAPYDSGSSVHKRATISRKGDPLLRSKLFCGALGGVRGKNQLRTVYQSFLARGKAKKLALVACARKAATWAWAVFSQDTTFDSSRFVNA